VKRRLFLTGEMGCGKSTAILTAVGGKLPQFGGFLTKRVRNQQGQAVSFYLTSPDGAKQATFLDCSGPKAQVHMEVFQTLAPELMVGQIVILDEIGGMELLCPEFTAALDALLASDVPILGVLKGEGPASAMIRRLGLTEEYEKTANALQKRLTEDENTLVYQCSQFDPQALTLAEQWVKEYAHD
jgi:nucleoside-triphosphatase